MAASHRKWVLPKRLWHFDICLSFCNSALHILKPMFDCLHKAAPLLDAAARCLERINPLLSNLFCFQLMRIDAYPRLCFFGFKHGKI